MLMLLLRRYFFPDLRGYILHLLCVDASRKNSAQHHLIRIRLSMHDRLRDDISSGGDGNICCCCCSWCGGGGGDSSGDSGDGGEAAAAIDYSFLTRRRFVLFILRRRPEQKNKIIQLSPYSNTYSNARAVGNALELLGGAKGDMCVERTWWAPRQSNICNFATDDRISGSDVYLPQGSCW